MSNHCHRSISPLQSIKNLLQTSNKPPTNLQQTCNKTPTNFQQTSNHLFNTVNPFTNLTKHSSMDPEVFIYLLTLRMSHRCISPLQKPQGPPTNLQQKSNKLPTNLKKIVKLSYHFRFLQPFS